MTLAEAAEIGDLQEVKRLIDAGANTMTTIDCIIVTPLLYNQQEKIK